MDYKKMDYFIEQTNKRLESMEEKLDRLISFRVMLIGVSIATSSVVSVGLTLLEIWVLNKH